MPDRPKPILIVGGSELVGSETARILHRAVEFGARADSR